MLIIEPVLLNSTCQLSPCEETVKPEYLKKTDLYSLYKGTEFESHENKPLLLNKPTTLEVKGHWLNYSMLVSLVCFTQYFNIGQHLVVNFIHIATLCQANFVKLYLRATKHKINTNGEYLTSPITYIFPFRVDHQA